MIRKQNIIGSPLALPCHHRGPMPQQRCYTPGSQRKQWRRSGGRQDCVQGCMRFSAVGGHEDMRKRTGAIGIMSGLPGGLVEIRVLL